MNIPLTQHVNHCFGFLVYILSDRRILDLLIDSAHKQEARLSICIEGSSFIRNLRATPINI